MNMTDQTNTTILEQVYEMVGQLSPVERRKLAVYLEQFAEAQTLSAEAILARLGEHAEQLRVLGVTRIGLFGSYVRGEARLDSDIDLLVTFSEPSFDSLANLKAFLETLYARPVHLGMESKLRPELREFVLSEIRYAEGI